MLPFFRPHLKPIHVYARIRKWWSKKNRKWKRSPKIYEAIAFQIFDDFAYTGSSKSVGAISSERLVSPWKMRKFVSSVKEVTRNRHSAWLNLRRACSRWKEKEDSSYPRAMFKGCATPFYTSTIFSFFGALLEILIRLIKNRCIIFFPKTCFNNINNNQ